MIAIQCHLYTLKHIHTDTETRGYIEEVRQVDEDIL